MSVTYDVECSGCRAQLEVEVTLETNETLADDEPEDVVVHCPSCGGAIRMTLDSGVEGADVRVKT